MAEHTYKKGDVVATRRAVLRRVTPNVIDFADDGLDLAPWLSADDQSALLRVVKAAMVFAEEWGTEFHGSDWREKPQLREPSGCRPSSPRPRPAAR